MEVSVVSTQLWRGDNDLVLDLLDADSVRLDDDGLTATLRLTRPDGSPGWRVRPGADPVRDVGPDAVSGAGRARCHRTLGHRP